MNELLNLELTSVLLTLLAYQAGAWLQKKTKSPVCNPILVGVVLVLVFMALTGLENGTYQGAMVRLSWLMTPATGCLAQVTARSADPRALTYRTRLAPDASAFETSEPVHTPYPSSCKGKTETQGSSLSKVAWLVSGRARVGTQGPAPHGDTPA